MAIELLSTRLANQIAAGEVVERPASVIKELVENALDAGATKILIDVEKGGCRLLRVRDNGCGVAKDQLMLALSRHATSKIKNLDDLEAIVSLGFRGEALASISSVSRLTFASKTATQSEAWQAFAQGRDMAVEITPVAHPQGTTVEVADLFFNTPARRRFLRTEKTEFNHIDELIKRFALSRFDVEFVLKHNDKPIRSLKIANTQAQKERRVAAICSNRFMEHAIAIAFNESGTEHNDVKLNGWLGLPEVAKSYSDVQYCYVNGRMMRDKLINHAIRQAYQEYLPQGAVPSYVLYIELDPSEVDVNVHPAKHEVRFHQSRVVHDLIIQVLGSALTQSLDVSQQAAVTQPINAQHSYVSPSPPAQVRESMGQASSFGGYQTNRQQSPHYQPAYAPDKQRRVDASVDLHRAAQSYQQLMTPSAVPSADIFTDHDSQARDGVLFGQPLALVEQNYLSVLHQSQVKLLSLLKLNAVVTKLELQNRWGQGFVGQPLLLPVSIKLDCVLLEQLNQSQEVFRRLGIDITLRDPQIIIKQVPQLLRDKDIALLIPQLLQLLSQQHLADEQTCQSIVCDWLAQQAPLVENMEQAQQLIHRALEFQEELESSVDKMMVEVDYKASIDALKVQRVKS